MHTRTWWWQNLKVNQQIRLSVLLVSTTTTDNDARHCRKFLRQQLHKTWPNNIINKSNRNNYLKSIIINIISSNYLIWIDLIWFNLMLSLIKKS